MLQGHYLHRGGGIDLAKKKFALISGETFEGQKNPKNVRSLKLLFFRTRIGFLSMGKLLKYLTTLTKPPKVSSSHRLL